MEASANVSEGMRALFEGQKKLHDSILTLQQQIEDEESVYLEETPHGNIIRGWDGFIDSKQPRKDATTKKIKPYTESEHLFSSCCLYTTLGSEPTMDLGDPSVKEEAPSRRKLSSAAAAGATGNASASGSTTGTPVANGSSSNSTSGSKLSSLQRASSFSERRGSIGAASSSVAPGKGGNSVSSSGNSNSASASASSGKASKLKKRKREKLETSESAELDDGPLSSTAAAAAESRAMDAVNKESADGDF